MRKDDFSAKTVETLAKRAGCCCSRPGCRLSTSGPHSDPAKSVNIGVAAHITAASTGGPRYDASLTGSQRRDIANAIWLCQTCSRLIDVDPLRFPVPLLRKWRTDAEADATVRMGNTNRIAQPSLSSGVVHAPFPSILGLSYHDARPALIATGWQPIMRRWSQTDDIDIAHGNGASFWESGYWEIIATCPTGMADCVFGFADAYGNKLQVVTQGEEYPEYDACAHVTRFWLYR